MSTKGYQKDFASFDGKIWLNAASEGPLPLAADKALQQAVTWKLKPYLLDMGKFVTTVTGLKRSIGRLLGVDEVDVILGNSASYGLHLLANGILWKKGDEILTMQNDFPTNILPWLALEKKGVIVRQIKPKDRVLEPEELRKFVSGRTRLLCLSHVHTFSGYVLDVEGFATICKEKGIVFVLNLSQSLGAMPVDVGKISVDAVVSAGYKWLCGPYGTGFCWIKPSLRKTLTLNQAYWAAMLSKEDLLEECSLKLKDVQTARRFDVFGTANFFNHVPLKTAIDYWLESGLENVKAYHDTLVDRFIAGLRGSDYELISPEKGKKRSSLIVLSHADRNRNTQIYEILLSRGIYTALWKGNIRIAPHVYNTAQEIDQTVKALREV